eukprot:2252375-Pleurochrysis_carterae.AAC.3
MRSQLHRRRGVWKRIVSWLCLEQPLMSQHSSLKGVEVCVCGRLMPAEALCLRELCVFTY